MKKPVLRSQLPNISLEEFRKMIATLPAEKLATIPPEKLPEDIPMSIISEAPLFVQPVVETLLLERNSYALRTRQIIKEGFGTEGLDALDVAKRTGEKANLRVFATKLLELKQLRQRGERMKAREADKLLSNYLRNIDKLLPDILTEHNQIIKGIRALKKPIKLSPYLNATIEQSLSRLEEQREMIDKFLADYYSEKISVAHVIMQRRLQTMDEQESEQTQMAAQVEEMRSELVKLQKRMRLPFGKKRNIEESDLLRKQITQLTAEMKVRKIPVDEAELTLWLDALVESSMNPDALERARMASHMAKKNLLNLLQRYCEQQESSARQVARNPFVQVEPRKVIEYTLKSEQFILNYFQQKRIESTSQLSLAAEIKIDELNQIEKELLQELKKSSFLL
jgi:hypothetical protein